MSLTSYRAAPPRVDVLLLASSRRQPIGQLAIVSEQFLSWSVCRYTVIEVFPGAGGPLIGLAATCSPTVRTAVPWARRGFTVEFGMGSCGSHAL